MFKKKHLKVNCNFFFKKKEMFFFKKKIIKSHATIPFYNFNQKDKIIEYRLQNIGLIRKA